MKRNIARYLLASFCAVLLQAVLPDVTLAQRKLVRVDCNDGVVVCLDSLFVEEGTIPHDSCEMIISGYKPGDATVLSLLFTNFNVHVSYTGSADHAAEFKELSSSRGVIDSSNSYLLNDQVKRFLELLKESVGYESVVAGSIAPSNLNMGGPFTFTVDVPKPGYYTYWSVMQLWALVHGVDTSDVDAVYAAQNTADHSYLYLAEPCLVLVSAKDTDDIVTHDPPSVCYGAIPLSGVKGRYTIVDINGRIVAQGEVLQDEVKSPVPVQQGLYVLVTATQTRTVMVLP